MTTTARETRDDFIGQERYIAPGFAALERERLWLKSWQMACREEEIPHVGDRIAYDVVDQSVVVLRTARDTIKAFHNVCPHRGRRMVTAAGGGNKIHCPFHGWQWNLDGEVARVLDREDWNGCSGMQDTDLHLAAVRVGRWGGFVFISMDPQGESFEDFIHPVPEFLNCLGLERMRYGWIKTVPLKANWKVAQEAFMESYHLTGTHPQVTPLIDDKNWSREQGKHGHHIYANERPMGSPNRRTGQPVPADLRAGYSAFIGTFGAQIGDEQGNGQMTARGIKAAQAAIAALPDGSSVDAVQGAAYLAIMQAAIDEGVDWPVVPPEQYMVMGVDWNIFPNLSLVFGLDGCLVMRARPSPDDPETCLLDLCSILLWGKDKAPKIEREFIPDWQGSNRHRIPSLLWQDLRNIEYVQQGMHSVALSGLRPNPVQERQISHFHKTIDGCFSESPQPQREPLRRVR